MKINNKDYNINNIIEMAWCDKTSFDSIKFQTNLSEKEVIKIMRSNLKKGSFQIWRERVCGRKAKHCLLYTSPSPRDLWISRMPSSA